MLSEEAALSIILDKDKLPKSYGVLTPASGIGLILIDRLNDKGISFIVDLKKLIKTFNQF